MKVERTDEEAVVSTITHPTVEMGMAAQKQKTWVWKGRGSRGLVDLTVDTSQEEFGQAGGSHLAPSAWFSINHILENLNRKTWRIIPNLKCILTRIECFSLRSLSSCSRKVLAWLSEPIWINWIPSCTYIGEKHPRRSETNNVPGKALRPPYLIAWQSGQWRPQHRQLFVIRQ